MLIPFGVFSAGAGNGGAAGSFDLISTTLLTGSQASVTFDVSTFASTYKHLQIRYTARNSQATAGSYFGIQFNGDTTAGNYYQHYLRGTGSAVNSYAYNNFAEMGYSSGASDPANVFSPGVVDILDGFSTAKNTTVRALAGLQGTYNQIRLSSAGWTNTAALTSIVLLPAGGSNFVSGSRFSLYGVK